MRERSFDEMIAYFNRRVSEMDIAQDYKMELLGMVTALGYKHEKTAQPEPQNPYSICDLCIYNPPSSMDGKPCSMCVAQEKPKDDDSWSYG